MNNARIWLMIAVLLPLAGGCQERASSGAANGTSRSPGQNAGLATSTAEDADAKILYRKDGVAEVSFDALKFDYKLDGSYSDDDMPEEIKELDGTPIVIRGYILPASVYQDKDFGEFVLIRDNQQCCFGPGAKLFHNMQIKMATGKTADYTTRPVTVEGIFKLSPYIAPDDKCYSVFLCTAESVKQ